MTTRDDETDPVIAPDLKDWTWVIDRPCPECGHVAADVDPLQLGALLRDNAAVWRDVLAGGDVARRPSPTTWSPLEYGCHVRDVHRTMLGRVTLMLTEDHPTFADWDQDATAVAERYGEQDPAAVAVELTAASEEVAATYDAVPEGAWQRPGLRSNGSRFTVESLGRYHLHDAVHHLRDVGRG